MKLVVLLSAVLALAAAQMAIPKALPQESEEATGPIGKYQLG